MVTPVSTIIPEEISCALWFVLVGLLAAATVCDLSSHRIPNKVTYWSFAAALPILLVAPYTPLPDPDSNMFCVGTQLEALSGAIVCFIITFAFWCFGVMGGGDVKLATMLGILLGASNAVAAFLLAHLLAAVFVIFRQAYQSWRRSDNPSALVESVERRTQFLPMAGFYALGTMMLVLL